MTYQPGPDPQGEPSELGRYVVDELHRIASALTVIEEKVTDLITRVEALEAP